MRILITGGAGFIGSHLVEYYQGKAEIRVLDNFRSGKLTNLEGFEFELFKGSILDINLLEDAMREVDYVYHLAAMVSVPESVANPADCIEINSKGTLNVLEAAAKAGVKKLAFSSSAAIYGERPENPKYETTPPDPRSPYAVTKLSAEYFCHLFSVTGRLPTICLRYFNVYGPRQDPNSAYAAAVPAFISRALAGKTLMIHGDGQQTRDFIHVRDIVAANAHACTQVRATGVFNVARCEYVTINELASTIVRLSGSNSMLENGPARPGDVRHSEGANEKIIAAGFKPSISLDEGLKEVIGTYR